MGAEAYLRLYLLLAVQLRCVSLRRIPKDVDALHRRPAVAPGKKAPQFMVDLFNMVSVSDGTSKTQREILNGNMVRSFEDRGHAGKRFHSFNLSSFNKEERMIKAEFRWFRNKPKFFLGKSQIFHFYKVDVFEVPDSQVDPVAENLITSRRVPLYTQGWEVFNVTEIVLKWIQNSQSNGIVAITPNIFLNWKDSTRQNEDQSDKNAFLVIFSDDGRSGASQSFLERSKSAATAQLSPHDHRSRRRRSTLGFIPNRESRPCQRVPLYVDFEEIGWSGWIIYPHGYNANHCLGSCPFPLGGSLTATNHATVLSIMYALRLSSDMVEPPCCVPERLESISLLYFDDDETVVLKQYDDMVAVSCGCQ